MQLSQAAELAEGGEVLGVEAGRAYSGVQYRGGRVA